MVKRSTRMRWVEHVAYIEEMRNSFKSSIAKPEWKRSLGRRR
jgi:hypothetical protein